MQLLTVSRATKAALALATSLLLACGGGNEDPTNGGPGSDGFVTLESITPDHGPLAGGNTVVVTGSGFLLAGADRNNALIDGILADRVSIISDTTLEVIVPPGNESGPVGITLFNGNGSASLGNVYSYNPLPTVTSTNPTESNYLGGEAVTITGTGFQSLEAGSNTVLFGEAAATSVDVSSDTSMTVTVPAGVPASSVLVAVENDNGSSSPHDGYLYTSEGLLVFGHNSFGGDVNEPNAPEPGEVFHLDPLTLVVEPIGMQLKGAGELGSAVCGDPTIHEGAIFAKAGESRDFFIRHDLDTNSSERLDPLEGCTRTHALASHQGELYAICRFNDAADFGRIDPDARTFTQIGNVTFNGGRNNLASDGTDLFYMENGAFSKINPNTGVLTETVQTDLNSIRGMAFSGGVLYAHERGGGGKGGGGGPSFLHSINPATGETQTLGVIGSSLRGLAPLQ